MNNYLKRAIELHRQWILARRRNDTVSADAFDQERAKLYQKFSEKEKDEFWKVVDAQKQTVG